ncbi:MAG: T9SS type B sorting domain-containing protein [Crocinitomix sp.]|nr:T9SS type B sorting domain-containing protein [Crocinitomix sp.]
MNKIVLFLFTFLSVFGLFAQDEIWIRPNKGQWHKNVEYKIGIPGGQMYLEEGGFTYEFNSEGEHYDHGHGHEEAAEPEVLRRHVVKTTFIGASTPSFEELSPSPFYENYFLGNNPDKWVSNSYAYEEIQYVGLYAHIDMRIYEGNNTLKYDVIINPGGNPADFKVQYEGQDNLEIIDGALRITTSLGIITEEKPFAYQESAGLKYKVECEYALIGNEMHFVFPDGYDASKALIIDPELNFSTFTGSTADNWGMTACPDIDGKMIGGGIVFGTGYPITVGAFDDSWGGIVDLGITKFTDDGGAIIFSTYIGGSGAETPHSIIVNDANELYIMGATSSTNFPVGGTPYQAINNLGGGATIDGIDFGDGADIYIIKLSADGNALLGGTFLGGTNFDGISESGAVVYNYGDQLRGEVYLDAASNVYITSTTTSTDFPIVGGFDATLGGGKDAILAKLNPDLSNLLWSTYIGGSGHEAGNSVKVSPSGDIFTVGGTTSTDLPNTAGNIHPTYQGGITDGYLMKLTAPAYTPEATYLGTDDYDQAYSVELDIDEFVYVYGQSSGPYQTDGVNYINANSGQFIHKISNDLGTTEWSSVFGAGGGVAEISPTAFLVSDCYEIYIAGWGGELNVDVGGATGSTTTGFPTTPDAYQDATGGSNFYLAVFTADMAALKYATFMGDPSSDGDHVDGGTSRFDKSGTIYHAVCAACGGNDWPTTPGAFSEVNGYSNCNMAVFQFELAQIDAVLSTGAPIICIPDPVLFENDSEYGDTYFWDFGDDIGTSTDFEPSYFYAEPGIYTVMLIVSDAAGCYEPDTAYIEVEIQLFEGTAGTLTDTICPGSSVQLFATGGDTYTWGPADLLTDPFDSDPIATITEETTFTVTIESVCGTTELTVTVYVFDVATSSGLDTAICVGGEALLTASGGDTYLWAPPEDLDDPTIANPTASPPLTTYYTVDITTEEGCLIQDTIKVHVDHDIPYPNLIDEVNLCKGDSIRITAGGATDYLWTPDYNISDPTIYNPYVYPDVDTDYSVTFTNACGSSYDTVKVYVIVIDGEASPDTLICPGDSAFLWATGGEYYQWYPGAYLSSTNTSSTVSTPPHDMTYWVYISDDYGCVDSASVFIELYEPPAITVSPAVYPIAGDTVTIWAEADGSIYWTPPYNIACQTCATTIVWPEVETFYTATVTDVNGCTNYAVVPVYFDPLIYVPNAFTPDGDSFNNVFRAIAHNIDEFEMLIFNRWGELIYQMEDLDDYWDGSYNNSLVTDDVYVWQIVYTDLKGIAHELRGHVVLLK